MGGEEPACPEPPAEPCSAPRWRTRLALGLHRRLAWGGNTLGARHAASLFIFRRRAASRLCELPPSPAEFSESPLADYRQRGHLPHRLQYPDTFEGALRVPQTRIAIA